MSNAPFFFGDEDQLKFLIKECIKDVFKELNIKVPYNGPSCDTKTVYSREEIAYKLGRHVNTVSKYIRQRRLHATKINGIFFISETSFLNFINHPQNGKN